MTKYAPGSFVHQHLSRDVALLVIEYQRPEVDESQHVMWRIAMREMRRYWFVNVGPWNTREWNAMIVREEEARILAGLS